MDETNNIFELKFFGNEIRPEKVKPSEIAQLLANFERVIINQAQLESPGIDSDEVLFCFDKIDDQSLDLIFKVIKLKEILVGSYLTIATAFNTGDYSKIDRNAISPLRDIVKFTRKHNCEGSFKLNDETLSSFTPNVEINYNLPQSIKGETTIYGKIIRVGGEEPRIHFRTSDDEKLIFDIDEILAKKLATKLYDFIGITGTATWNINNFKIENFKIDKIIEIDNKPITETLEELRGIIGKYWDEVEDVDSYLN
ncbi:MAG TPA: hypothetical protein PKE30_01270 [Niabella sp.]|nr:hypothetical protein [Niabella sp.]